MGAHVEIELRSSQLEAMLNGFRARAADFRLVFRGRFHEEVGDFFRRQWQTEGAHGGTPWPPPSPTTLARRQEAGVGGRKPLWASGRLRASLVDSFGEHTLDVQPMSYHKTSSVPYSGRVGVAHSSQFRGGPQFTPARRIMPDAFPTHVVQQWQGVLMQYLMKGQA